MHDTTLDPLTLDQTAQTRQEQHDINLLPDGELHKIMVKPISADSLDNSPSSASDSSSAHAGKKLSAADLVQTMKRINPYLIRIADPNDKRSRAFKLNHSMLINDIIAALGTTDLQDLQDIILRVYGVEAQRLRIKRRATPGNIDVVRSRFTLQRRRNTLITSGLIIGQSSYADLHKLLSTPAPTLSTSNTPSPSALSTSSTTLAAAARPSLYQYGVAGIVYILIKQGSVVFKNIHHPDNTPLLTTIKRQAPVLHKFLTTDHFNKIKADPELEPIKLLVNMATGKVKNYNLVDKNKRLSAEPDNLRIDDGQYMDAWNNLLSTSEFATIAAALDTFLRYTSSPQQAGVNRPTIVLNPEIVLQKVSHGSLIPVVYGSSLNSAYNTCCVNLSRVLFGVAIERHDLWAGWRGDNDRRYYAEHGKYATRGSKNRLFGWACKQLDNEFHTNTEFDLNPFYIAAYAVELLETHEPYKRVHDKRPALERLIEDTAVFDTRLGEFVTPGSIGNINKADNAEDIYASLDILPNNGLDYDN